MIQSKYSISLLFLQYFQLIKSFPYYFNLIVLSSKQEIQLITVLVYKLLKYNCKYPVTTALQGRLALLVIPWLKVAGATYSTSGNCDSGPHRMFHNCLSTLGPVRPTEGSRTTKTDVVDWKPYLLQYSSFLGIERSRKVPEPITRPLLSFINSFLFKQATIKHLASY